MRQRGVFFGVVALTAVIFAGSAGASTTQPLSFEHDGGESYVRCEATEPRTIVKTGQSCTIIQPAGGTAWCVLRITKHAPAAVVQRCKIRQASTYRENVAHVVQVIEMKGWVSLQDATQIADIRQGNGHQDNRAHVSQVTTLALGRGGHGGGDDDDDDDDRRRATTHPDVGQAQEAHQSVIVCQGAAGALGPWDPANCRAGHGMRADNVSSVSQKQSESEHATGAGTIVQEQNTDSRPNACTPGDAADPVVPDADANACANVDQSTQLYHPGAGKNHSQLTQRYVQSQEASRAHLAFQCQGFPGAPCYLSGLPEVGGLDHTINQSGPKRSEILTEQHSFQVQRVDDVTTFVRKQDPRISKGTSSAQGKHPDNVWKGLQTATQLQFEDDKLRGDTQAARLEYFGKTSGKIRATQVVNQNGKKKTNSCSGWVCAAVLECTTTPPEYERARLAASTATYGGQTCTASPGGGHGSGHGDDDEDDDDDDEHDDDDDEHDDDDDD